MTILTHHIPKTFSVKRYTEAEVEKKIWNGYFQRSFHKLINTRKDSFHILKQEASDKADELTHYYFKDKENLY